MTKSDSLSLSEARIGRPLRVAGPSTRRGERLVPGRVEDDPDRRPAVDDQPDRDAEDRDAVGVVDGAVERVDDPDPATPRGGRLARHRRDARRSPRPGSRRPGSAPGSRRGSAPRTGGRPRSRRPGRSCSRSARAARSGPSGRPRRSRASSSGEGELGGVRQPAGVGRSRRVTVREHSTSSGSDRRPEHGHVLAERERLAGVDLGLRMNAPGLPVRSAGSVTRQVVWPVLLPWFVTVSVSASPPSSATARRDGRLERPDAGERELGGDGQDDDEEDDPDDRDAVDLRARHVAQPERVAALAQPDVDRHRARRSGRRHGSARA